MRKDEYDLKVIRIIKAVRDLRNLTQLVMANVLSTTESSYNKIENGHHHVELWQIRLLAKELKISFFQVLVIAEVEETIDFGFASLPEILGEYKKVVYFNETQIKLNNQELEQVILKIKKTYYKS